MELEKLISGKKVYFDINIFIYLIDGNIEYKNFSKIISNLIENKEFEIVTSSIIFTEIFPKFVKNKKFNLISEISEFIFGNYIFQVLEVSNEIAIQAGILRGQLNIKIPDSLHLATAIISECEIFLTNDNRLQSLENLEIIQVEDFL